MITELAVLIVLIPRTLSQLCDKKDAVDISTGIHIHEAIFHRGINYEPNEYYVDENGKEMGCVCLKKQCISKCCPFGQGYHTVKKTCVAIKDDFDPPLWDKYKKLDQKANDTFHFTFGKKNCTLPELRIVVGKAVPGYHVRSDGQLFIELPNIIPPWTLRGPDKYCIDTFVAEDDSGARTSRLDALICFADKQDQPHYMLSSTCMVISCVFILATVGVYAWLPELRNLHGRVLMVYLLCLFVGFAALSSMQIMLHINYIFPVTCVTLSIIIYFSLESAFFWLNVMCFDIWWTFSGKRGLSARLSSTRARFLAYCAYAFGIPTVLTVLLISLEFSGLPPHPMMPLLRHQGCFLYGHSKLIYLYSPMLLVCLSNMVFFALTATKINQIKRQTSVLKNKDNGTHDQHRNDKQRLTLYLKLFMVMGINWILEVISALYPDITGLWNFTDAYNVLIGLIIFIIFVCKRKIFRLIKKRIKNKFYKDKEEIDELRDFSLTQLRRRQMIDQRASQETIRTSIGSAMSKKTAAGPGNSRTYEGYLGEIRKRTTNRSKIQATSRRADVTDSNHDFFAHYVHAE